jgi:hypothetical protein
MDTEYFFPGRGQDLRAIKRVCSECPVSDECLEEGMAQKFGVWGGLSEHERRKRRVGMTLERRLPNYGTAPARAAFGHGGRGRDEAGHQRETWDDRKWPHA